MAHPAWLLLHPNMTPEALGYLPGWLDDNDERGAAEQLDGHYAPYGGFAQFPMDGFTVLDGLALKSPGDPVLRPLAVCRLRDEVVCFYPAEIVAVFQPDGSYVAARFD